MLTLQLKKPDGPRIDARGLAPGQFTDIDLLVAFSLPVGNQRSPVAGLFDITGHPADAEWQLTGDCSRVDYAGHGLSNGRLAIDGPVGRHCGARMRGGRIEVSSDADDWLGAEMRGGEIRVRGNAGRCAGGGYTGSKFGMRGGSIVIAGRAGPEAGRQMRRGVLIAVGGCGELAGYRMRAGTLLTFGPAGGNPGLEMLRGTIGLFGKFTAPPATFRRACRAGLTSVRLLRSEAQRLIGAHGRCIPDEVDLYNGDLLRGGRGELLMTPD